MKETSSDTGASAVEYAIIVVAIAAVITIVVVGLGSVTKSSFGASCKQISQRITGECPNE